MSDREVISRDGWPRDGWPRDGWRMLGAVPLAQAIHHADDHRSHVLSILGARGLEAPDLDV
jgi:hypothetical protein